MPVFRSEVMRMEVTPDEVLLIDRMNKRYVRATRDELKELLPENADFDRLEKLCSRLPFRERRKSLQDVNWDSFFGESQSETV